jgi:type IV secretory pathway VirB6-like protein
MTFTYLLYYYWCMYKRLYVQMKNGMALLVMARQSSTQYIRCSKEDHREGESDVSTLARLQERVGE